ncbi:hypothetical protein HPB48_026432 [Haemaphysalis longicornis]|uniref:UBA domain-containing protein n=1 Tax=Haemaphysalis longicornis TaxID=44386 RepID=A0A9J6HBW8_HAELO|nr:hypothetical protein HPB48_026432 [Haemaphysalis longicornis]
MNRHDDSTADTPVDTAEIDVIWTGYKSKFQRSFDRPEGSFFRSHSCTILITLQYDFDLELKTIEFAERYRREQESKRQAQTERVAADIQQFTQPAGKEQPVVSDTSPGSATSVPPPGVVTAAAAAPSSILQPAQASEAASTAAKRSTAEKSFSLAEFENDASSPFDFVELQTINDLEELSSVFQGMTVQSPGAASGEPEAPAGVPAWEAPELSEACVVNHNDTGASVRFSRSAADVGSLGDQKVAEHQTVSPPAGLSPRSEPTPQQGTPERVLGAQAPAEVIPPLLRSLMDMGFDKHRAQRALQSQGSSDDKKVVEYLCQVQSLVDAGFSDMDAEEALRLNPDGYQQVGAM